MRVPLMQACPWQTAGSMEIRSEEVFNSCIVANWGHWKMADETRSSGTVATADDPALAEGVARLVAAYHPRRVYLFGSVARGDAGPDSDYDLLLIVGDDVPPEQRRSRLAYEALWGTGLAADVLVWTESRFESRKHVASSLPATVLREGRLLHGA